MFGDIKMKTKKKIEMIEMMTLKIVVIIVSRHMRITLELENRNATDDSIHFDKRKKRTKA